MLLPRFSSSFLDDHAGLIMTDPKIALVEVVLNCWDAGADRVDITWPQPAPDWLVVQDNGTGLTEEEFLPRWLEAELQSKASSGRRRCLSKR